MLRGLDGWMARPRLHGGGGAARGGRAAAAHRPQGSAHRAEMVSAGDGGGTARSDLICVTGGNGFIGSWPVRFLLDRGYTVHTTVKNLGDMPPSLLQVPDAMVRDYLLLMTDFLPLVDDEDF